LFLCFIRKELMRNIERFSDEYMVVGMKIEEEKENEK
jgi:hypothetical protein